MTESPDLPAFTPVPLSRSRHDGWSPDRQRAFVAALAATGTVGHAARAVGMGAVSAYALRKRPGAESFAEAWDLAVGAGRARMVDWAMERALNGVTTIRVRLGGVVEVENGLDRRIAMAALKDLPPRLPRAQSEAK